MDILPDPMDGVNSESPDSPLSWGSAMAPLLPLSLRKLWADETLPWWVGRELSLTDPANIGQLDATAVPPAGAPDRIRNFLALLVHSRIQRIRSIIVLDHPWPGQLAADQVPWKLRTRNCLLKTHLADRLPDLPRITFGDLFDVPGMGALSVLDFACTLEAVLNSIAVQPAEGIEDDLSAAVSDVLTSALDEPWSDWVSGRDVRFADLLPTPNGTVTERIDALTSNAGASSADLGALARAVIGIRSRIEVLARMPLEEELRAYVQETFGLRDRRLPAMMARLHLDGSAAGKTQDEAGAMAGGITRQRIQQLEVKGMRRHPPHPIVMPQLDRALEALLLRAPIDVGSASELLVTQGISREPFHPASIISAAKFCGRAPTLEIRRMYGKELVAAIAPDSEVVARVVQTARRQAGQAGASSVSQVAEALARARIEVTEARIGELLRTYGGADFLDDEWFCFQGATHDVVGHLSRKMLSVTTPLTVTSLRDGIKRYFRFRRSSGGRFLYLPAVPPRNVLSGYYKAHPDFAIGEDGSVRSVTPLDYRSELGGVEMVMVTVLKSAPSRVLDRVSLTNACVERGVNVNTLWTLATYSPVMEHLGTGLWTLRGTIVDPTVVESFRKENALRPRERRVLDHGWLPSGELWLAIRIPAYWDLYVFPVPADIGRLLAGRDFSGTNSTGSFRGTLRVQEGNRMNGVHAFLRGTGADEDDIVLFRFDLVQGTVIVSVVDDDALEELSPEA